MISLINNYSVDVLSVDTGKRGVLTASGSSVVYWGYFTTAALHSISIGNCFCAKLSQYEDQCYALIQRKMLNLSIEKGAVIQEYESHNRNSAIEVSKDKSQLVATGGTDSLVKLWDTRRRGVVKSLKAHSEGVSCLKFKENLLVTGGNEGSLKVWDLRKNYAVDTVSRHTKILELDVSNTSLAVLYRHLIRLYDLQSFESFTTISVPDCSCICFHNTEVLAISPGNISAFNLRNGLLVSEIPIDLDSHCRCHPSDPLVLSTPSPFSLYNLTTSPVHSPETYAWENLVSSI